MSATTSPDLRDTRSSRRARSFAKRYRRNDRLSRIVPGFDAPYFQAGLAGYSDHAMRYIARQLGAPYCVSEALLDHNLLTSRKLRAAERPSRLGEADHPLGGQVIGCDPDEMARAAVVLVELGFDVVDVNLACPSKLAKRRERGGNLLAVPNKAIDILRAVRAAVPARIPCTVKLRRAWDETPAMALAFERVFDGAYEIGYAWATVHSRTVAQRYVGRGCWTALAELVERYPDRLIFGSGDIETAEDIFSMLELCGVDAVAVARGAIATPWIFRQAQQLMDGREPREPSLVEQGQILESQFALRASLIGAQRAAMSMRKQSIHVAQQHPQAEEVRQAFIAAKSATEWQEVLRGHYAARD